MYFICRYTKKAVESVLSKIQIRHKEYYTSNGQRLPFLNYQLIAEVLYFKLNEVQISGMCKRSYKSKMCYHHIFGHWIGLRAVIVFDHSYVYNLSTKHMQDFELCSKNSFCFSNQNVMRNMDKNLIKSFQMSIIHGSIEYRLVLFDYCRVHRFGEVGCLYELSVHTINTIIHMNKLVIIIVRIERFWRRR